MTDRRLNYISVEKAMRELFESYRTMPKFRLNMRCLYDTNTQLLKEDALLDAHLLAEFSFGQPYVRRKPLTEEHGYIGGLSSAFLQIEEKIYNACEGLRNEGDTATITLNESDFERITDKFFDKIVCRIKITKSRKGDETSYYDEYNSGVLDKQRVVRIGIEVQDEDFHSILSRIETCLSHELIHAYQDIIMKQRGRGGIHSDENTVDYTKINKLRLHTYQPYIRLGNILYFLYNAEQNSYIGQAHTELLKKRDTFTNAEGRPNHDAIRDSIKATECMKVLRYVKGWLTTIRETTDPRLQEEYVKAYRYATGKGKITFNQILKELDYQYYRMESKATKQLSKMAHDIFAEGKDRMKLY